LNPSHPSLIGGLSVSVIVSSVSKNFAFSLLGPSGLRLSKACYLLYHFLFFLSTFSKNFFSRGGKKGAEKSGNITCPQCRNRRRTRTKSRRCGNRHGIILT
ncbi:MAG: hypothetical protein ILM98_06740, partial [Kiritimatiellae bacterium]|nr:hypothetical protein [Kiritimatiellia bacterium]